MSTASNGNESNSRVTMARLDERLKALEAMVNHRFQSIEVKMDLYHLQLCETVNTVKTDCEDSLADHETRVRKLEETQRVGKWLDIGTVTGAIGAIATAIASIFAGNT